MADADSTAKPPPETYRGNCQCAAVRFTVTHPSLEGENASPVMSCNCSICSRNGYLFIYPPKKDVVFLDGSDSKMSTYYFGNKKVAHYFCPTCGTSVSAADPDHEIVALNVRTLLDFDIDKVKITQYLGGKDRPPLYSVE